MKSNQISYEYSLPLRSRVELRALIACYAGLTTIINQTDSLTNKKRSVHVYTCTRIYMYTISVNLTDESMILATILVVEAHPPMHVVFMKSEQS